MDIEKIGGKDILFEDSYIINIVANPINSIEEIYDDNVVWGNKQAVDFLFEIVSLLKCEMDGLSQVEKAMVKDKFARTVSALRLFRSEFREGKDLEKLLVEYIEGLKEHKFTIIKKPYHGCPDFKEVRITAKQIQEKLYDLRRYRISYFKIVLEEYKKNRAKFDDFLNASV